VYLGVRRFAGFHGRKVLKMGQAFKGCWVLAAVAFLSFGTATHARADMILWYNGDADGINSYINQDNAQFHEVLYNDFNVTGNWVIDRVWSNNVFVNGPPASTTASWEIRTNMPTGTLVASGDGLATLTPTGFTVVGLTEYQVQVSGLSVSLSPGTYWLAVFPDDTNGGLAGNDTTSGANAVGTPAGNNGNLFDSTENPPGPPFGGPFAIDTSAGVAGSEGVVVPEPASMSLLGIGIACLAGYGWRRRLKKAPEVDNKSAQAI
jgi:hypothetical protein